MRLDRFGSIFSRRGPDVNLRRPIPGAGLRLLEILLVLGVVRVPFPQVDYHNVRHHHAAGQVCPHHDHLLRRHPTASQNEDVALLHWHWFLPNSQDSGRDADDENTSGSPISGTAIHAHLYDGMEPEWGGDLVIRSSGRGQCLRVTDSGLTTRLLALAISTPIGRVLPPRPDDLAFLEPHPNPHAGLLALAQRRNC